MLQDQFKIISLIIGKCHLNGSMIAQAPFISASFIAALALMAISLLYRRKKTQRLSGVFVTGLDDGKRTLEQARKYFVSHCADMLIEGYEKTLGGFFYVPSPAGDRLMIPTRYIEELKNSPDEDVDFSGSFLEMFMGRYTTIGLKWHLHPGVVKKSLNANLADIMPSVEEEIYHAFDTVLPSCENWTAVTMADKFTDIISCASNRMMGGKALSRNAEWTATSINFTTDTWLAAQRLKRFPPFLRPIAQYLIPEMAKVRHHGAVARRVIVPIIENRLQSKETGPLDLLQMLWDGAQGVDKTPEFMAYTALAVSFAAIRTSSSVPTHLLYDLCAHPEYIEPLRQEIGSVLAEEGSFTKAALNKLVKLDSFMKESQRFNPLSFLTFGRLIHRDLSLHDGIVIPAGTLIGVPAHAIALDPKFLDPKSQPPTFSGFRFVPNLPYFSSFTTTSSRLRQQERQQQQSDLEQDQSTTTTNHKQPLPAPAQFVTTNARNLSWGYGKHACSGRFFAAHEIKIIIAHFLLTFDFRFRADADGKGTRPPNIAFELQNMADPSVQVLLKRRTKKVTRAALGEANRG